MERFNKYQFIDDLKEDIQEAHLANREILNAQGIVN